MRIQQMLRGQRLPPIPHLLSVMVQPKQVSSIPLRMSFRTVPWPATSVSELSCINP